LSPAAEEVYRVKFKEIFKNEQKQINVEERLDTCLTIMENIDPPRPIRGQLNALRMYTLWAMTDAFWHRFGEDDTYEILMDESLDAEFSLIGTILSLSAVKAEQNAHYKLDTGGLSRLEFWNRRKTGIIAVLKS
jgi:hypothetical protein